MTETKTQSIEKLKQAMEELTKPDLEWSPAFQALLVLLEFVVREQQSVSNTWLPITDLTPRDQPILVIDSENCQHVVKWREDIRYEETRMSDDSWLTERVDHGWWEGDNSYYCGWPKFWRPLPAGLEKSS